MEGPSVYRNNLVEISQFNSYADVSILDEDQLRVLLAQGDEPVKVWAAWALGIKLNNAGIPDEIRGMMKGEPSPGIRQNMLVFLAGNGNGDILETFARADPNANVRAAACNLIGRVAKNVRERNPLLEELLVVDDSSEVHATILNSAIRDRRIISNGALRHVIKHHKKELQKSALDVILTTRDSVEHGVDVAPELKGWAKFVHSQVFEQYCCVCLKYCGAEFVLLLADIRHELATIPINLLIKMGFRTDWMHLKKLAARSDVGTVALALNLLNDDKPEDTVEWLLEVLRENIPNGYEYNPDWFDMRNIATQRLYSNLIESKVPRHSEFALPVLQMLKGELHDIESPDPDDTWDQADSTSTIEYYRDFIHRLEHWV